MKTETAYDLTKHQFPKVDGIDIAFPTFHTDKILLEEAERLGFGDHYNPYNKLFSKLFFSGGKVTFKQGLDEDFKKRVWNYLRAFMGSYSPKHEHKEAICAYLLSHICEPEAL